MQRIGLSPGLKSLYDLIKIQETPSEAIELLDEARRLVEEEQNLAINSFNSVEFLKVLKKPEGEVFLMDGGISLASNMFSYEEFPVYSDEMGMYFTLPAERTPCVKLVGPTRSDLVRLSRMLQGNYSVLNNFSASLRMLESVLPSHRNRDSDRLYNYLDIHSLFSRDIHERSFRTHTFIDILDQLGVTDFSIDGLTNDYLSYRFLKKKGYTNVLDSSVIADPIYTRCRTSKASQFDSVDSFISSQIDGYNQFLLDGGVLIRKYESYPFSVNLKDMKFSCSTSKRFCADVKYMSPHRMRCFVIYYCDPSLALFNYLDIETRSTVMKRVSTDLRVRLIYSVARNRAMAGEDYRSLTESMGATFESKIFARYIELFFGRELVFPSIIKTVSSSGSGVTRSMDSMYLYGSMGDTLWTADTIKDLDHYSKESMDRLVLCGLVTISYTDGVVNYIQSYHENKLYSDRPSPVSDEVYSTDDSSGVVLSSRGVEAGSSFVPISMGMVFDSSKGGIQKSLFDSYAEYFSMSGGSVAPLFKDYSKTVSGSKLNRFSGTGSFGERNNNNIRYYRDKDGVKRKYNRKNNLRNVSRKRYRRKLMQ